MTKKYLLFNSVKLAFNKFNLRKNMQVTANICSNSGSNLLNKWVQQEGKMIYESEKFRLVCYPSGKENEPEETEESTIEIFKDIRFAQQAWKEGKEIYSSHHFSHIVKRPVVSRLVLHPDLYPIVTRFPRNSTDTLDPNDLSLKWDSPYYAESFIAMFNAVGIPFSIFCLPIEATLIIDESIRKYLNLWKEQFDFFVNYSKEHFFKAWKASEDFKDSYSIFSSIMWSTVEHFMLGIAEENQTDFAYVWNNIFAPPKQGIVEKSLDFIKKFWNPQRELSELKNYILDRIKESESQNDIMSVTIFDYWKYCKLFDQVWNALTPALQEKARSYSEQNGMTPSQLILRDIFFGFMIGMQENMASLMTSCLVIRKLEAEKGVPKPFHLTKFVREIVNFLPTAGSNRELRCPMDIFHKYEDGSEKLICLVNKKDIVKIVGIKHSHVHGEYKDGKGFNSDRKEKVCPEKFAFSQGPQKCPGQNFAINYLEKLYDKLSSNYEPIVEYPVDENNEFGLPRYVNSFTLKPIGVQVKLT